LQGHLLIAAPTLLDPNFLHTVVLIVQHNDQGALGLILNRPTPIGVATVWAKLRDDDGTGSGDDKPSDDAATDEDDSDDTEPDSDDEPEMDEEIALSGQVHHGGPCEGPLMILHDLSAAADLSVVPGVSFTTDRAKIEHLFREHDGRATVFVGYSGWTAGQLEQELSSNSWLVLPATPEDLLSPSITWQALITRAFLSQYVPMNRIPPDPHTN
jgi:putative transcriptional regulator